MTPPAKRQRGKGSTRKSPEAGVEHDLRQLTRDGVLLIAGLGLMFMGAMLEEWIGPWLGPDGRSIAHLAGVLGDIYVAIRLVGPNGFAVLEALVTRTTDLLVLIGRSWHRVRRAFSGESE
jgi:hypothetical protein